MEEKKELVIALADAEQEAVLAVNSIMQRNGLPCYLMEPIIDKIHNQLIDGKATELAEAQDRIAKRKNVENYTTKQETEETADV